MSSPTVTRITTNAPQMETLAQLNRFKEKTKKQFPEAADLIHVKISGLIHEMLAMNQPTKSRLDLWYSGMKVRVKYDINKFYKDNEQFAKSSKESVDKLNLQMNKIANHNPRCNLAPFDKLKRQIYMNNNTQ